MEESFKVEIEIENNSEEIKKALEEAIEKCLYAMGVKAVEGAVTAISKGETQAVDTGRLRASISFITAGGEQGASEQTSTASKSGDKLSGNAEPNCVYVGSNVNYAEYVHNGTSRMGARPFLRRGIENVKEEMKEQVLGILKGEY